MLSKHAVALSADKAFAKRIAAGLMAAGVTVESFASLSELPGGNGPLHADLVVVHLADGDDKTLEALAPRLQAEARLVVVIPASSLGRTVDVMRSGRVSVVLVADEFEPAALASVASRLLHGDVFGLEKVIPHGVRVYSLLVGDYQEKSVAIGAVSEFAASMGVRRKYRESIEQCLDEMLMNALYDAPVDTAGKQMFADVPTKTRISLRMEQKAVVQYACDGNQFAVSVRDSFGALKGETVIQYLDKCLHSAEQIDRKIGGAGLGLYIISNQVTQFLVNLYPGVATEALCTFDLNAPKIQIKELGIFHERIDSAGRLTAGPSRLVAANAAVPPPPGPARWVTALLGAAVLLLLTLIGFVAYPRLRPTPRGSLAVSSHPSGALLEVDGVARGTTGDEPLILAELDVGQKYKLTARHQGYEPAVEIVAPRKGSQAVTLELKPQPATLIVKSSPAGATVLKGSDELGVTPLTLGRFEPGSHHTLTLRKVGYAELTQDLETPGPGERGEVVLSLSMASDFGSVRIDSDPPGAEVLQNGDLLAGLRTPIGEHIVQAGKPYTFTIQSPGYTPEIATVTVRPGERLAPILAKLRPGARVSIDTNVPEAHLTIAGTGAPLCAGRGSISDCALANGTYKVRVAASRPYVSESFDLTVNGTPVSRRLDLGFVETATSDQFLQIAGAPNGTRKAGFSDGERRLAVVDSKSGEVVVKPVKILAGRTVIVDTSQK